MQFVVFDVDQTNCDTHDSVYVYPWMWGLEGGIKIIKITNIRIDSLVFGVADMNNDTLKAVYVQL